MIRTALPDEQYSFDTPSQRNVGTLECIGSIAFGSAMIAYGLSRRPTKGLGIGVAAAGTSLVLRGATGHCPVYSRLGITTDSTQDTRTALAGERGVKVREAIRLEKPVEEVYAFWRSFENLPRFMRHLERVQDIGNSRSHWVAKGPAGMKYEWDAEIINEIPNQVIGWRSLAGSDVVTAGSVNFDRIRGGGSTQVTVKLQYSPPAGRLGKMIAQLFGAEPSQAIREDLRRLKWVLEAGEIPRATDTHEAGGYRI